MMARVNMADTEKITINMSVVDLGKVDLLVEEGFYQNRTDFIRTAIRLQLNKHDPELDQAVVRNSFVLGVLTYTRKSLEKKVANGERVKCSVIGMLVIEKDVPSELAVQAFESIKVHGVLRASLEVKNALKDRIR
jgi:Arc/MetJ-type ribon-helix-helix transcriptional regulator